MPSYSFKGIQRTWTQKKECHKEPVVKGSERHHYKTDFEEKWPIEQLCQLLRLYGVHRCLWDTRDKDNRNRKIRHAALVDITAALGNDLTLKQVVRKINVLRATYRYEKRRIKQRIRKGIGAKTRLKWFSLADSYLRNVPKSERGKSKQICDSDTDLEGAVVSTIDSQPIPIGNPIQSIQVKTEEELGNDEGVKVQIKTWDQEDSLRFVKLLGEHSCLWRRTEESIAEEDKHAAIAEIAKILHKPLGSIEKRLSIFLSTWQRERQRMLELPGFKPKYIWWLEAAKFMECEKVKPELNFIDASQLPPPTPLVVSNLELKEEIEDIEYNMEFQRACIPPPVSPTRSENTEEVELIEDHSSHDSKSLVESMQGTKLILNGLEDDLIDGKWSLNHSVKFLRLYGVHRCLWDLKHPDYRSRDLRQAAMSDIAAAMGYGLTAEHVAKKIKIFRITYMQHRKRMLKSIKEGKEPKYQLRWYPLADSFLRPHIGLRSIKEQESEVPQFDFHYVLATLNLIDPALLTDFRGKGTQNTICIGNDEMEQQFVDREDGNFEETTNITEASVESNKIE